jgi:hypothetical protein
MKNLSRLIAMAAATIAKARTFRFDANENGVPVRAGHRSKRSQRKKHTDGRFRAMCRVYESTRNMPKGIVAPGFEGYTNINGSVYLIKHGTHYRLDKLARQGRVTFAAA